MAYHIDVRRKRTMAITRDENNRVFDFDTVNENLDRLTNVEIGRVFVSKESAKEISEVLGLDGKNEEELRAIRNAVVVTLHKIELKEAGLSEDGDEIPGVKVNYERMMFWSNKISGITAVIDEYLWKVGGIF